MSRVKSLAPMQRFGSAQRRETERGSVLFIVVMVMTLLTAIGMYSMRAASLAQQAVGFNRLGMQTGFVADFGARSVMTELVGKEQQYFRYIRDGRGDCRANRELAVVLDPERPSCYKLESNKLWEITNDNFPGTIGTDDEPELLGEMSRANTRGAFIVEMTDLARAGGPIAGEDVAADAFKYMQVLLTATAQVRPGGAPADEDGTCNQAFSSTSGLQTLRAQVTFGPVN